MDYPVRLKPYLHELASKNIMAKKNIRTHSKIKKAQAMIQAKQYAEACELYEKICALDKRDADSWKTLGSLYGMLRQHDRALEALRKSIELRPNNAQAQYNFGIALRSLEKYTEAWQAFQKAFSLDPNNTEIGNSLAHICITLKKQDEAIEIFKKLLVIRPEHPETLVNLGTVYQAQGKLSDAIDCYNRAQVIKPGVGFENLGAALSSQGKYTEAINSLRTGLKSAPDNQRAFSNVLLTLNYIPDTQQLDILAEHQQWQTQYGKNIKIKKHTNTREPDRRLRIGYVSPDMRSHSVASFFEPLLAKHDANLVETFCYSSVPYPDEVTERLMNLSHQWRDISRIRDADIVKQIRDDKVDILVDLSGHTSNNHLTVFLHKPAPIQVTWLGYPNTTGLDTIDYRFTDALADPDGQDRFYTEQLYRLPDCFLCYQGLESSPDISSLPALDKGYITFGSFNNLAKMNDGVIKLWSDVLCKVKGARLLIKNPSLTDPGSRERIASLFAAQGITSDRLELLGLTPSREEHLGLYSKIDIALDIFPYNGTTTTCEALWMGVPVISLTGDRHAGRVGLSLLTAAGLEKLVANSKTEYVDIAKNLAANPDELSIMRKGLRAKIQDSVLCDSTGFAEKIETAYREIWKAYCSG